ncbi:MAG: cytochrome c biogenesis protein CcsA [Candidatus Eisenbacteria bacterium]|nr:cytochrome c biogenesis protein CcsA [Candidatus Eisenbacteria bacterium]
MRLVLTHQYQYSYVYRYSSNDLPLHFLVSTFWAGQEGTFLLWALYTAVLGIFVIITGKKFESGVMSFVLVLQIFLLMILVKLSPFALLPTTPLDGAGLNPLLQDYWMVIHPPLLFVGFASFTIPAAFAMHAMARGDEQEWVRPVLPWTAFGVLVLGTAICLGGYWAYRTLGWGGYWGWDPVENSSLVPWMFGLALLHGLVVQRRRGTMARMNLFLAVSAFMLILYSTFLTRSGVLGDFSVHSFVDLGINGLLIAFVIVYGLLGFGLYAWRMGRRSPAAIATRHEEPSGLTREYAMFLGALTILLFAVVILLGTSAPLLTRIGGKPSNVALSYYHVTAVPFGMLITSLLAVGPLLLWGHPRRQPLWRALLSPLVLAALATVLFGLLGVHKPHHLGLVFTTTTAIFVNLEIVLVTMTRKPAMAGGYIAHVGIGLMILGIITSTVYDTAETIILHRGQMAEALGYRLTWTGERSIDEGSKTAYDVTVLTGDDQSLVVSPVMFFSRFSNAVMRRPGIHRFVREDLYLAPQGVDRDQALDKMVRHEVTLGEGESTNIGESRIRFIGFEPRSMKPERIEIAAMLEVIRGGRTEIIKPLVRATGEGQSYEEALSAVDGSKFILRRVDPKAGRALFYIREANSTNYDSPIDTLYLEVGIKPYIGILWLGTFLVMGGLVLTVIQRARTSARGSEEVTVDRVEPGAALGQQPVTSDTPEMPTAAATVIRT